MTRDKTMPENLITQSLNGNKVWPPPLWMMRQAGRHLPEYQQLRRQTGDFLTLCQTPELAAKISLQPVLRYDLDAAIVFSDILFLLKDFGCNLHFDNGPVLTPIPDFRNVQNIQNPSPVFETIAMLRAELARNKALIGFAGGPFTLAVYALAGTSDPGPALKACYQEPQPFLDFLGKLADAVALSLAGQAEAGADVLMLFDSWAGGLDPQTFRQLIIEPNARVRKRVRELQPHVPMTGFPRGAGTMLPAYARETGMEAIGLDTSISMSWADQTLPEKLCVQGNLDPLRLLYGGNALQEGISRILQSISRRPLIFNLGHGIHPQTPIPHVEKLVEQVRNNPVRTAV